MPIKQYIEKREKIRDGHEIFGDNPRTIAKKLVEQIKIKNKVAINVDRRRFYYFQRKRPSGGRRCSCWGIETSPDGFCQVCYATGVVGGYDKYGCITEIVDVTHENISLVNVLPDYNLHTRPVMWSLLPTAVKGYLEVEVPIQKNNGVLDALVIARQLKPGGRVDALIKSSGDADFVPLTKSALETRLGVTSILLKVELSRSTPEDHRPILSHIMLRYRIKKDIEVLADIPREEEAWSLAELGTLASYSTIQLFVSHDLTNLSTEDFFHEIRTGRRFKPISVNPNRPFETLTSWDLSCRIVQQFDVYTRVI